MGGRDDSRFDAEENQLRTRVKAPGWRVNWLARDPRGPLAVGRTEYPSGREWRSRQQRKFNSTRHTMQDASRGFRLILLGSGTGRWSWREWVTVHTLSKPIPTSFYIPIDEWRSGRVGGEKTALELLPLRMGKAAGDDGGRP